MSEQTFSGSFAVADGMTLSQAETAPGPWIRFVTAVTEPRHLIGLSIWRVSTGLCLLYWYLAHYLNRHYLWGPQGVVPYREFLESNQISLYALSPTRWWFELVFHAGIAAAAVLALGWRTRVVAVVNFVLYFSIYNRNNYFLNAGDNLTALVQFLLLFAWTNAYCSLDATRSGAPPRPSHLWSRMAGGVHNAAWLAAVLQLATMYTIAGMQKISGDMWNTGTALYYVLRVSEYSFPPYTDWLTRNAYVVVLLSYRTIVFQIGFALALTHARTRLLWVAGGIAFHVGIGLLMGLVTFSWFVLSVYALLITDDEYRGAARWCGAWFSARRLFVYYDGSCPACVRAVGVWRRLDICSLLQFRSFRESGLQMPNPITLPALERRIHAMDAAGRVTVGSEAVLSIAARLVPLWPLCPFIWILNRSGLGDRVYCWIADRRFHLVSLSSCFSAKCEVSPDVRWEPSSRSEEPAASGSPSSTRM